MIKKILLGLTAVIALVLAAAALQPADFKVERTATIAAPAERIFAEVSDFHRWDAWSPWAKLDPEMKTHFEGPTGGVGAIYTWTGNSKVGEGRMTVAELAPGTLIRIKLEFLKPFVATNMTEFAFKGAGAQTEVVWTMTGTKNFVSKLMGLFMSMDKMVGKDFEKGLTQLKAAVEKS